MLFLEMAESICLQPGNRCLIPSFSAARLLSGHSVRHPMEMEGDAGGADFGKDTVLHRLLLESIVPPRGLGQAQHRRGRD